MPKSSPSELAEDLTVFDLADLAAAIGGLQLIPVNAERQLRFDLLASILSSLPAASGRHLMSPARWRRLLNEPPIGGEDVRRGEDPAEQLFTSFLSFDGGAAVVFGGIALGSVEA